MRMADCLMFRHACSPCDIKITDNVVEKLGEHQEAYYKKKLADELRYWVDQPAMFIEQMDPDDRSHHEIQHNNFT